MLIATSMLVLFAVGDSVPEETTPVRGGGLVEALNLNVGDSINCEERGKWLSAKIINTTVTKVQIQFTGTRKTEWLWKDSDRIAPVNHLVGECVRTTISE